MAKHRQPLSSNPGTIGRKHCPVCHRQVLSAYRGEVTAVGKSVILSATRRETIAQCECGKRVSWEWEVSRNR